MKARILVVDDEPVIREVVTEFLQPEHEVVVAEDVEAGMAALRSEVFDLVLTDVRMPGGGGHVFARQALAELPDLTLMVMSGQGTTEDVTAFLRLGACDYLLKPLMPRQVLFAVARALKLKRLRRETDRLQAEVSERRELSLLHGDSPVMRCLKHELTRVASTDVTVLLVGRSGTGKELAARSVHDFSRREDGPFVAVNCGALTDTLLESTLFGHARGAFTGADRARPGCFEQAHRGTLFLDEVGTMSPELQVRLLRVLSAREVTRLGEEASRPVDARIVAATNVDLGGLVKDGGFREDLYYRLSVFPIHLPDLCRRGHADIDLLADLFLTRASSRIGRSSPHLSDDARGLLRAHSWPGNVRELENALERALIFAGSSETIEAEHVVLRSPSMFAGHLVELPEEGLDLRRLLGELEAGLIEQALELTENNKQRAATLLGLNRTTLGEKLKRTQREAAGPMAPPSAPSAASGASA